MTPPRHLPWLEPLTNNVNDMTREPGRRLLREVKPNAFEGKTTFSPSDEHKTRIVFFAPAHKKTEKAFSCIRVGEM